MIVHTQLTQAVLMVIRCRPNPFHWGFSFVVLAAKLSGPTLELVEDIR